MSKKKNFWWSKKEAEPEPDPVRTFTEDQVKELVEQIKVFNAGAIDVYLTKHVDSVFEKWLKVDESPE